MSYRQHEIKRGGTLKYRIYQGMYPLADVKTIKEAKEYINLIFWTRENIPC